DEEPVGLWADAVDPSSTALSLELLRILGRNNAGLALAVHRRALTRWLLRQTGLSAADGDIALTLTGHYGLARCSLARWLRASMLEDDDRRLLSDWLDRHAHDTVLCAAPGARQLLWPVWTSNAIQWQLITLEHLSVTPQVAHGLDELQVHTVRRTDAGPGADTDLPDEQARALYANALRQEWLGLTAIGLGLLERGGELAREYAAIRSQGGKRIGEHPAVQAMLGEIRSAVRQVELKLNGLRQRAVAELALAEVATLRLSASEQLVHACHQVIQIHGGIGYMRDTGPEKFLRDQNMLRLAPGGVFDLPLFLQGAEARTHRAASPAWPAACRWTRRCRRAGSSISCRRWAASCPPTRRMTCGPMTPAYCPGRCAASASGRVPSPSSTSIRCPTP